MNAGISSRAGAACFAIFAGVVAAVLPGRVILRGDDFGYIESAANTIRAGHWVPSHWLEPFNVPLPMAGAVLFQTTGNFWLATTGLGFGLTLLVFLLLRRWLRPEGAGGELAVLAVALLPVGFNKLCEYTGVPLGTALTLMALLAWRRRAIGWFFLWFILAMANRQSAVCLLALPAVAVGLKGREAGRVEWRLVAGLIVACLAVGILVTSMPPTFAREMAAARMNNEFSRVRWIGNLALGAVMLAAIDAGWACLRGELAFGTWRENLRRPVCPLLLTGFGAWLVLAQPVIFRCETPGAERFETLLVLVATFFGAWWGRWQISRPPEVWACAGLYALLIAWRGQWWDYYLLEPALVLAGGSSPLRGRWPARILLAVGCGYALLLRGYLRDQETKTVLYEQALRAGKISIVEASDAPFGFLGWKLFHVARMRGTTAGRLSDFGHYVEGGRGRKERDGIAVDRVGGRKSLGASGEKWLLPSDYRDRQFPLTNAEWREWLSYHPER